MKKKAAQKPKKKKEKGLAEKALTADQTSTFHDRLMGRFANRPYAKKQYTEPSIKHPPPPPELVVGAAPPPITPRPEG